MTRQLDTPLYERINAKFEIADLRGNNETLSILRKKAYAIFQKTGFPSIKNEEWKYTNILPFLKEEYAWEVIEQHVSKAEFEQTAQLISRHLEEIQDSLKGEHKGAYRIVSINGRLNKELSVLPDTAQMKVATFAEAENSHTFQSQLGHIASLEGNPFAALNTALFTDGLFLEVPEGAHLDKPVHIVNVFLSDTDLWLQPRHLIVVHPHASLDLIETILPDEGENKIFINALTEISVAQNAQLHHYDLQTGRTGMRFVQRTEATQQAHSNYSNYTFTLPGTDLVRNNLVLHLDAPDLESHLYGLYLASGNQLVDNHTEVHHKRALGTSNQLYKGVLLDKAKAVFNGKIHVYPDAQKTNAFQQSNNILFSEQAAVHAKPQLEIFADDVKCSHGTTVGQLNKEALFYLRSRGISEDSAKSMMVNAFAFDVTQKVKNLPLRVFLEKLIARKMRGTS